MDNRVEIRETVPGTVFELRRTVRMERIGEDIRAALGEMYTRVKDAGLHPVSPPSVTYLDRVAPGRPLTVDVGVAVAPGTGHAEIGDGARIVGRHARPVARIIHHGDYARIGDAYQALDEWIARHGYRAAGPPTETYLVGPEAAADPAHYRTEVCLPVVPSIGLAVHLDEDVTAAARRTREVLTGHDFSIIFEKDMRAMLQERIGAQLEEYVIFGVCAPDLALRTLDTDRQAGLLLPCTVVVRATGDGSVVEALDPTVLVRVTGMPDLEPVASETRKRLDAVLAAIRGATG